MFFLGALVGFIVGLITYAIFKHFIHTHDYELLFHRNAHSIGFYCECQLIYNEETYSYDANSESIKEKIRLNTYASYRKCKICGKVHVSLSDGTKREYYADYNKLRNDIEAIMITEQRAKEEKDLKEINRRLYPEIVKDEEIKEQTMSSQQKKLIQPQ